MILDRVRGGVVWHTCWFAGWFVWFGEFWGFVCYYILGAFWYVAVGRAGEPCDVVQQAASDRSSIGGVWLVDTVKI